LLSDGREKEAQIIDAHQDLVRHIEQGVGRIRLLSILTLIVSAFLAVSYISQLILPLAGTKTVTVNLSDPSNVAVELVVLALAVVWLYVGASDLRFSWRMKGQIEAARTKEKAIQDRIS